MKVRRRVNASGGIAWQVDYGVVDGRRIQRSFASREMAEAALREAKTSRRRLGESALVLTSADLAEVGRCKERLAECGASLPEAVDFFLAHAGKGPSRGTVMVPELVELFIRSREDADCSDRYRNQLRVSLRSLGRARASTACAALTRHDVELWLRGNHWAAKTRNGYMGDVRAMYAWAVKEGYARLNPCAGIEKAREARDEIGTLNLAQCERLLRAAVKEPRVCAYVVLSLFCGIRRAEIERMKWEAIDVEHGTAIVGAAHAKTRARRVVDISENARAWLKAGYGETLPEGKICKGRFGDEWLAFRKPVISVEAWPHNAMRHTYASMHYAMWENEARLQVQMGHESASMLHRHYRALKTKAEAARFWALRPEGKCRMPNAE